MMMRRYAQLPDPPSGAALDDVFSIIVPIARTNLVTNPSIETNTTGWTGAIGGETLTRSAAEQYHGAYSLQVTPTSNANAGCYFSPVGLTSGTLYAVSCKVKANAGLPFRLQVRDTTGVTTLSQYTFIATGRWQWIWLYYAETASVSRRIYIQKNSSASVANFYVDGLQVEALGSAAETVSTYIDGDQQGLVPNQQPPAYLWTGTPHASSSQRSGLTRAGGVVVKFKDYNLFLTAIIGLGLAVPQNVRTEYARIDGAFDDYTRKPTRQFTLTGQFQGRSYQELRTNRSAIAQLLDRDLVGLDQRMALLHHIEGPCGDVQTNESRVLCKYTGGMGGNTDNQVLENAAISFEQYLPYVQSDSEQGSALTVQQSVSNANYILQRTPGGVWQAFSTGMNNTVLALALGSDGTLYAGGGFTLAGGVANTAYIAKWNGSAWSAMGTGGNSDVRAIVQGPDGTIYAGGLFTSMSGVANTAYIAKWNGSAWSALGTGMNNPVLALAVAPDGTLYAGGTFTLAGGVANTVHIAKWNGSAWSALSTGMNNDVYSLAVASDGTLYAGGIFTTAGGVGVSDIAKWNGSAWSALGSGTNNAVWALAIGPNGLLYAGGDFTTAGGVTANSTAQWNGTAWQPLGTGVGGGGGAPLRALTVLPNGLLYAGGDFTTAGGVSVPDGIAVWNGASWIFADVNLPGTAGVFALLAAPDGTLTAGFSTSGTAVAAGITTVTNGGTARTYPTLRITGPTSGTSRTYQIIIYTTGHAIYLNYTIAAGEIAILRSQPDNLSFVSSFQGNIASKILPGSNESDLFLQPGANIISFYAADSTVVAVLYWRPCFVSLDDVR